jgi:arginase
MKNCILVGAPVQEGASQRGCRMGPEAIRTAGLAEALTNLGHAVSDMGDVVADDVSVPAHPNSAIHDLDTVVGFTTALDRVAYEAVGKGTPIFMGGDHSLSAGTVTGVARAAKNAGKPLFVLWLDAHPDFHKLHTTQSGNLHGSPVAYFTGQESFDGYFPELQAPVDPANICMIGLRSVDLAEAEALLAKKVTLHDMRAVDEFGIVRLLRDFIDRVIEADGWLHVSLDVDFLDPAIAPAVGTTVPGGATFREAHLIMEMLCDSGLVTSLDMVELNPFLDERGRTASLLVDLTSSLFGRRIIDRMTRSF